MNAALSPRTDATGQTEPQPRLTLTRPDPFWAPVVIRLATQGDRHALELLAQLDSARPPVGEAVIGELDGRLVAAVSLSDGAAIADPFVAGREIVELVATRARQLAARSRQSPVRRRWRLG
jgi:hypothetical protein